MTHKGLITEFLGLIILVSALSFAGFQSGLLGEFLIAGCILYLIWTLTHSINLYRWLASGNKGNPPRAFGIWSDISAKLVRVTNRRALGERAWAITASLAEGIIILDQDRRLQWWNPAAEQLFSLQKSNRHDKLADLAQDSRLVEFIQQTIFHEPLEISPTNNPNKILLISATTFGDTNVALVVRDITQLRHFEQARREFVSNISHELRTPLTVLTGYIETIQDNASELPLPLQNALPQMAQQTERMGNLASDLAMLSQLESMETEPPTTLVKLKPLIRQIAEDAKVLGGEHHHISWRCDEDLALTGESRELYSAISNLVFNAIRHNPEGADITISAEQSQNSIYITVEDNGVGIEARHIPRLTERFYRTDSSRTSSTGGTGLGLAIVKHVLLRHNGILNIRSDVGSGSAFICRFILQSAG